MSSVKIKLYLNFIFLLVVGVVFGQKSTDFNHEIADFQTELNAEYSSPETTVLLPEDFENFHGLEFYDIDSTYRVKARFVRTPHEKPFAMATTTDRKPMYFKYGEAHFALKGKELKLNLYKSVEPYKEPGYEDYLFLPFTDLTSGDGSYGGGRFIDMRIPEGDEIIIDFNKAYNPYCAYSPKYSCPITPAVNDLQVRVEAGVRDFKSH